MIFVNARAIIERSGGGERYIVVQPRNKPGEPPSIELPGGKIEPFESLTQALKTRNTGRNRIGINRN